ncbi:hypothetical protein EDC94DRAFT_613968 [Helicostylum pulchrum]|nr:hypothetical protein EDC94DRAFT_613968 [Helicostylum pulchrum]
MFKKTLLLLVGNFFFFRIASIRVIFYISASHHRCFLYMRASFASWKPSLYSCDFSVFPLIVSEASSSDAFSLMFTYGGTDKVLVPLLFSFML